MSALRFLMFCVFSLGVLSFGQPSFADSKLSGEPYPNLVGVWSGKSHFMLPDGQTEQMQIFEFVEQHGPLLKGFHSWNIEKENFTSHDGQKYTHASKEIVLGVIGQDGIIRVVEHGDSTEFRLRLLNNHVLDFTATEGGEHALVGHGVLVRE